MIRYINFADRLSAWFGKAFGWAIMVMALGVGYEVVVRRLFNAPTSWAFDISYLMYGTLFMMGGAYTLSRGGHVRGDFLYRLWQPRTQAKLLRMTSERNGVAAKVIATVDDLERIAVDENADVPALKGWRRDMFGNEALKLRRGGVALAIENGRVVAVEREPQR